MADIPAIPPSPPAPSRAQPDSFSPMADAFAAYIEQLPGYLNGFGAAMEVLASEIANQGFTATSSTSMTIGTGLKSFTASTGAAFIAGQTVLISANASPGNDMTGTVTGYDSVTGEMQVQVDTTRGSGTFSDWSIALTLSVDLSGYLLKAGGTMTGPLILPASTSGAAPLRIPNGTAPTSPMSGDFWTTTVGAFIRIATITRQLATLTGSETFTNKTLTNPTVDGGALNAVTFTGYTEAAPTATTGSALSPNLANGTLFRLITNGNAAITLPSPAAGKSFSVAVQYGGAHTLSWAGGARKWADGEVPTPTSVNGKTDIFTFVCLDGANWLAFVSGQNL